MSASDMRVFSRCGPGVAARIGATLGYSVSNCCANRGFAGATVSGHFAQTGPVLGGRLRAGLAHLAPAGPLRVDFAWRGSLLVHFARTGPAGAFSWAGP